jgi:hypothetical protein
MRGPICSVGWPGPSTTNGRGKRRKTLFDKRWITRAKQESHWRDSIESIEISSSERCRQHRPVARFPQGGFAGTYPAGAVQDRWRVILNTAALARIYPHLIITVSRSLDPEKATFLLVRNPLVIRRQSLRLRQRWAWFDQAFGNTTGLGRKERCINRSRPSCVSGHDSRTFASY